MTTDLSTVPELTSFYQNNPGFDVANSDLLDTQAVDTLNWGDDKAHAAVLQEKKGGRWKIQRPLVR